MNYKPILLSTSIITILICCSPKISSNKQPASIGFNANLLLGKWVWYKTITSSDPNGLKPNGYDTFYMCNWFLECLPNKEYVQTAGDTLTGNYTLDGNLIKFSKPDAYTAEHTVIKLDSCTMVWYDRAVYTNVKPAQVVEYWQYFAK